MYWRHFDLSAEPFSLTPDPAFLYLSSVHAEAFAALSVGLRERRGLIAMIGEVGTGKTTLVYSLLSGLGPEIHTAYISNARLSFDGILRSALRDFGVDCPGVHVSELLDAFNRFLHRCAEDGTTAALVIDEAQNLSRDTFEDLRLLTNFETYKHKLLQIVLVGQPELDTKLRDPSLRQVADRIAVRCHVNPLTPQEVRQYLQHRLAAAGGSLEIFSEAALRILVRRSRGIPRSINILGHNAMLFAYGAGRKRVGRRDAIAAIREREGRGLVRFEPRLPSWFARLWSRDGRSSIRLRYSGLFLVCVLASLLFFALRPAARETPATSAPAVRSAAPTRPAAVTRERGSGDASANARPDRPAAERASQLAAPPPASARERSPESAAPKTESSAKQPSVAPAPERTAAAVAPAPPAPRAPADGTADTDTIAAPLLPSAAPAARTQPVEPVATSTGRTSNTAAIKTAPVREAKVAERTKPEASPRDPVAPIVAITQPHGDVRMVPVSPGSSLYDLITAIYGEYDPRYVPRIQAMNPQVKDPNYIFAGDKLRFPDQIEGRARDEQP